MLTLNRAMAGLTAAILLPLFVLGCSDDGGEADAGTPPTQSVAEGETPQPGPPGPAFEQPPGTTASSGGTSVEMGVGTYCWTTMCVDKIGPITRGTLAIASGDEVVIAVPDGAPPLNEVNAQAFPAANPEEFDNGETAWQPDFSFDGTLTAERDGDEVRVEATLEPGTWVLVVGMFFKGGDVQYSVVLEVE
jgi:hypothetical protein